MTRIKATWMQHGMDKLLLRKRAMIQFLTALVVKAEGSKPTDQNQKKFSGHKDVSLLMKDSLKSRPPGHPISIYCMSKCFDTTCFQA